MTQATSLHAVVAVHLGRGVVACVGQVEVAQGGTFVGGMEMLAGFARTSCSNFWQHAFRNKLGGFGFYSHLPVIHELPHFFCPNRAQVVQIHSMRTLFLFLEQVFYCLIFLNFVYSFLAENQTNFVESERQ